MAHNHGVAGEWARVKGAITGLWPAFIGVFFLGASVAAWIFADAGWGAVCTVVSLLWVGISFYKGARRIESFYKGARGEEKVAGIIRSFSRDYHVFNDFVANGWHVDHVVVGPTGVYAVETKNWKGRVTEEDGHILVDGHLPSRPPLAQVIKEAQCVKSTLAKAGWTGDVTPILAFASDTFTARIAEIGGVVVINSCELKRSFDSGRVVLSAAEIERLVGLMEAMR